MSDCMPRIFDVTALVPVTTRVEAGDEAEATALAYRARMHVQADRETLAIAVLSVSVGFPQEITVKEVATGEGLSQ